MNINPTVSNLVNEHFQLINLYTRQFLTLFSSSMGFLKNNRFTLQDHVYLTQQFLPYC
jgi:hypothetical protein